MKNIGQKVLKPYTRKVYAIREKMAICLVKAWNIGLLLNRGVATILFEKSVALAVTLIGV